MDKNIKVIISEAIMVLAVVVTVIVLALIVSGYWINANFELERQGMLQVSSVPTGADITIDGESSWLQRTNTSKTLPSGEHTVTLTKDGYDTWSKTINIREGLLYRLHYPRLFLNDRVTEKTHNIKGSTFATVSPGHETLILVNKTTEWTIIRLASEEIKTSKLDIANLFSSVSLADKASVGVFSGEILAADWSKDAKHLIIKAKNKDDIEWVLIDIENHNNSINLTKEFGAKFTTLKIINDSASSLLAVQDGNLRRIDASSKQLSSILVEDIIDFDYYNNEILFSAKNSKDSNQKYYLGFTKLGSNEIKRLKNLNSPMLVAISKFYDEEYLITLKDNQLTLYKKKDFIKAADFELNFAPDDIKIGYQGTFITMSKGPKIATLDMEAMQITEWQTGGENFGWLDDNMIYSVAKGELMVYDFDGLNRRQIAKNVSQSFPVMITDNRWLYYVSNNELMREWLIPR